MSSSKCSFTCICEIFLPLNPSATTVQFLLGPHFTPACLLLLVCSLHFTHSLHFTPGPQSSFYTDRIAYHYAFETPSGFFCQMVSTPRLYEPNQSLFSGFCTRIIREKTKDYLNMSNINLLHRNLDLIKSKPMLVLRILNNSLKDSVTKCRPFSQAERQRGHLK